MLQIRKSTTRGKADHGWLNSMHTFSFANYYDPRYTSFGPLRVINEDRVAPGAGFPPHRHANMEILSYVLEGGLSHQDSSGGGGVIKPGELQWMSAGHGVEHSEFNASQDAPVHFLQVWIQPDRVNAAPTYAQQAFDPADRHGRWATLASRDGVEGGLPIRQDARVLGTLVALDEAVDYALEPGRLYWLHVASGEIEANGRPLLAGDALGFSDEAGRVQLSGRGAGRADVLLFDLPR